ncbi:MAG TPA: MotA/TolQ/ExbB proton channel family protein [Bacteriovoracaceae bacterium]|nr:MotA/TolQ/ExbB proton channel family protein [Bacteriovoracaceae bacterium]
MNLGAISAIVIGVAVLLYGLILSTGGDSLKMFYDFPSVFIVLGGVVAATVMAFQYKRTWGIFKVGAVRILKGKGVNYREVITEVIKSVDSYRKGESLSNISSNVKDPFFKEGLELFNAGVMNPEQVLSIMEERNDNLYHLNSEDAGKVKVIGKYPPAFGMMGTTMGMIVLLANLDGSADAIKRVGPAMGVCLITTLYGTIMANLGFLPFADNMVEQAKEVYLKNRIIQEGLKNLIAKENPILVAEKLNSFLQPEDRLDWKTVLGGH